MKRTNHTFVKAGRVYFEYAEDCPNWPEKLIAAMGEELTKRGYFIRSGPTIKYHRDNHWEAYPFRLKARAFFVGKKKVKEMIAKGVKIESAAYAVDSLKGCDHALNGRPGKISGPLL